MFTGIIQSVGRIVRAESRDGDLRLVVRAALDSVDAGIGASIAVAGCCLTVAAREAEALTFDVSNASQSLTTLGQLRAGDTVNLEPALRLSDRLGGHLVSGHVDGVGTLVESQADARSQRWTLAIPAALARYVVQQGSIAVDGVSLTVNAAHGHQFEVNLVPHTLAATTFGGRRVGDRVNLEVDMLARYVEGLLAAPEH
jgi:riboflavin synthase